MGQVGISLEGRRRKPESLARLKQAARKLFVERGYDATRPQDIAREAGLGHGTFYLHYPDKRACFFSFVEDARQELDAHLHARRAPGASLEQRPNSDALCPRTFIARVEGNQTAKRPFAGKEFEHLGEATRISGPIGTL